MFNMKNLMTRALLALALTFSTGAVLAGPTYHVAIDTAEFAGTQGYLDLSLVALGDAAPAFATLSNFTGSFGSTTMLEGYAFGGVETGVTLGNSSLVNAFTQLVNFGGRFGFDVSFDLDDGAVGSAFGVALFNEAFDAYLGAQGNIVDISLQPGETPSVLVNSDLAAVGEVPEPSNWMLMASGLMLLGSALQRRRSN
jgi:hypothetical protein